jgi:hypothetical protein
MASCVEGRSSQLYNILFSKMFSGKKSIFLMWFPYSHFPKGHWFFSLLSSLPLCLNQTCECLIVIIKGLCYFCTISYLSAGPVCIQGLIGWIRLLWVKGTCYYNNPSP